MPHLVLRTTAGKSHAQTLVLQSSESAEDKIQILQVGPSHAKSPSMVIKVIKDNLAPFVAKYKPPVLKDKKPCEWVSKVREKALAERASVATKSAK